MASEQVNNNDNEFLGFALAIVFIVIGGIIFFGWEQFGNEILLKILAMLFVLIGFSGFGMEIAKRSNESAATDLGIGLAIILSGLILGDIQFSISLNLLVLFVVGFGAIPVLSSIFKLFVENRNLENPDLSFLYKTLIITGQVAGSVLAIIEFVQFFMN